MFAISGDSKVVDEEEEDDDDEEEEEEAHSCPLRAARAPWRSRGGRNRSRAIPQIVLATSWGLKFAASNVAQPARDSSTGKSPIDADDGQVSTADAVASPATAPPPPLLPPRPSSFPSECTHDAMACESRPLFSAVARRAREEEEEEEEDEEDARS